MPKIPENNAPQKTFHELQILGIRDVSGYLENLKNILNKTTVTIEANKYPAMKLSLNDAILSLIELFKPLSPIVSNRLIVIGNGGSAAIAMHTLADYANAGGLKTLDLFNPSLLTCMANDYGYENVFAKPVEISASSDDILFAISSSGQSPNILNACEAALTKGCKVITFSGFAPDNSLRKLGHLNFYVPSTHYGFVELVHQILIHCILDLYVRRKVYEKSIEFFG